MIQDQDGYFSPIRIVLLAMLCLAVFRNWTDQLLLYRYHPATWTNARLDAYSFRFQRSESAAGRCTTVVSCDVFFVVASSVDAGMVFSSRGLFPASPLPRFVAAIGPEERCALQIRGVR